MNDEYPHSNLFPPHYPTYTPGKRKMVGGRISILFVYCTVHTAQLVSRCAREIYIKDREISNQRPKPHVWMCCCATLFDPAILLAAIKIRHKEPSICFRLTNRSASPVSIEIPRELVRLVGRGKECYCIRYIVQGSKSCITSRHPSKPFRR